MQYFGASQLPLSFLMDSVCDKSVHCSSRSSRKTPFRYTITRTPSTNCRPTGIDLTVETQTRSHGRFTISKTCKLTKSSSNTALIDPELARIFKIRKCPSEEKREFLELSIESSTESNAQKQQSSAYQTNSDDLLFFD